MDRKVRRITELYSKAAAHGDEMKKRMCIRLMRKLGIYEDVLYKLEKYRHSV